MTAKFWGETAPATAVSPDEAGVIGRDVFGIDGVVRPLGSNQETNLRIRGESGDFVLKIANPAFGADVLDLQNTALRHVAAAKTGLEVPVPVAALDGRDLVRIPIRGRDHHVRLLTFVASDMFSGAQYLGDDALGQFGALAARLSAALSTFDHAAADRALQYDTRHAARVVAALAGSVADPDRRAAATELSDRAWAALDPLAGELRSQVVHADRAVVELPGDAPVIDVSVTTTLLPEDTWTDRADTRAALDTALAGGYGAAGSGGMPTVQST